MNVNIYDKFISKHLKRRYLQFALVALVRAGIVLANQEILVAFIVRRYNWLRKQKGNESRKADQQKRKIQDMRKPTSVAIKEQVSKEVAEQLPDQVSGLVVETALKTSSKKKRKCLAKTITSQQSTKNTKETVQNPIQSLWMRFLS